MLCNRYFFAAVLLAGALTPSWAVPKPLVDSSSDSSVSSPVVSSPSSAPSSSSSQAAASSEPTAGSAMVSVPSGSAATSANGSLSVTVQGEVRGRVALERIQPPMDAPLKNLVELSRSGETERVLKENVGYLGLPEQMKLIVLESPLAKRGVLGEVPTYPFFVAKNPVFKSSGISKIVFQVLDATNQVLREAEVPLTQALVTWDGYSPTGQFSLKARDIYLPIFQVTRSNGRVSTLAGDGVKFDALRYKSGSDDIIEIYNGSLYPEDAASFSATSSVVLSEIFNDLRVHYNSPFEIVIYEQPRYQGLAKERVDLWRRRLARELLRPAESFAVRVADSGDRGTVTSIRVTPGAANP